MDSSSQNLAVFHQAINSFNDPVSRERYFDLYDENIVFHKNADGFIKGVTNLKAYYQQVWEAINNPQIIIKDMVANSDTIACRYTLSAVHIGPFMGVPGTNRLFTVEGMTFLRFKNERCIERWQGMDRLSLLQQLEPVNLTLSG